MTDATAPAPYRPMTGAQIKAFREGRGLSQQEFADLVGISKKSLGAYELNRADAPKTLGWTCAGIAYGIKPMGAL